MPTSPAEILRVNRQQALALADRVGQAEVHRILREAADDLARRLNTVVQTNAATPTSIREMQATLGQLRDLTTTVARRLGRATISTGKSAAEAGASGLYDYLAVAQKRFGTPTRPLAVRESAMLSRAVSGAESTILRRLATRESEAAEVARDPSVDAGDDEGYFSSAE
jgi:hypothetical protein